MLVFQCSEVGKQEFTYFALYKTVERQKVIQGSGEAELEVEHALGLAAPPGDLHTVGRLDLLR